MIAYLMNFLVKYYAFFLTVFVLTVALFKKSKKTRISAIIFINMIIGFIVTCILTKMRVFGEVFYAILKDFIYQSCERVAEVLDKIYVMSNTNKDDLAVATIILHFTSEVQYYYSTCEVGTFRIVNTLKAICRTFIQSIIEIKITFKNLILAVKKNISSFTFVYRC